MRLLLASLIILAAAPPTLAERAAAPQVEAIYPAATCVPENLLRFYIRFSEPMERGVLRESLQLTNSDGETVASPFLNLHTELWTRDQTAVTVLLDPGRIKRGVGPNISHGAPLEAGRAYELSVSGPLIGAFSKKPVQTITRAFCVVEPDQRAMTSETWRTGDVTIATRDTLIVSFDRLMDYGSIAGRIEVRSEIGDRVPGQFHLREDNRSLAFVPEEDWKEISYVVIAAPSFEDAAGNRFNSAFDQSGTSAANLSMQTELMFHPSTTE